MNFFLRFSPNFTLKVSVGRHRRREDLCRQHAWPDFAGLAGFAEGWQFGGSRSGFAILTERAEDAEVVLDCMGCGGTAGPRPSEAGSALGCELGGPSSQGRSKPPVSFQIYTLTESHLLVRKRVRSPRFFTPDAQSLGTALP